MARESLNFPLVPRRPAVAIWGAQAEQFLATDPDLALVRARQLVELLMTDQLGPKRYDDKLKDRIDRCHHTLSHELRSQLQEVRRDANDAVHPPLDRRPSAEAFRGKARKALRTVARAWWTVLGKPVPAWKTPPMKSDAARRLAELHAQVDDARDALELDRDNARMSSILTDVDATLPRLPAGERDHLQLRIHGLRQAQRNHQGHGPQPLPADLHARLVAHRDPAVLDDLCHLYNRFAVAHINRLEFDQAEAYLDSFLEWRQSDEVMLPAVLSETGLPDWQHGALLGSLGQLLAFRDWFTQDAELSARARACFRKAQQHFDEPDDLERQRTYELELLCDDLRRGVTLADDDQRALEELVATQPPESFYRGDHTPRFRLAVALKAAHLLGERPRWCQKVEEHLLDEKGVVGHPSERLIAALGRLPRHRLPKSLRQRLVDTAEQHGSPLIRWLCSVHVATLDDAPPPTVPAQLAEAYAVLGSEPNSAADVLPLNWAS